MGIQSWAQVTIDSFQNIWSGILAFLPSLIGALIILVIGLIIASVFRTVIERIINVLKIDSILEKAGLKPYFDRAEIKINSAKFFGLLVYWFFVIVIVLAISDVLGLYGVSLFLRDILSYIPNIIIAVIIMLSAIVVATFLKSLIRASVKGASLHSPKFLGALTWWTIVIFGFLASLIQLGIAGGIINTVLTGFIAMFALAGGIAFGLGGKDYAAHLLDKFRQETEEK
ncbi:MAG: hypothetical protein AAB411_01925 [Patescibacteria group bacterium]